MNTKSHPELDRLLEDWAAEQTVPEDPDYFEALLQKIMESIEKIEIGVAPMLPMGGAARRFCLGHAM